MNSTSTGASNDDDEEENEGDKNNRNLYDKAGKPKPIPGRRGPSNTNQDGDDDANIVSSNIKTIVVICGKQNESFVFMLNLIQIES